MSAADRGDSNASAGHDAFITLHGLAGTIDRGLIGDRVGDPTDALSTLATTPDVSDSSRFDVLAALARADFPDYENSEQAYIELATAIGGPHGLSADQVLTDLKAEAQEPGTIQTSDTWKALPHHFTAFFGRDVCNTARVSVGPLQGTWVFSEFETDASFKEVAEWVNPHNWPERSPTMFKSMKPVGAGTTSIPGTLEGDSWHGVFHEEVQLVQRLNTLLHCDYIEVPGVYAGVSYELTESLDNQINVDRGFLLVNELGGSRHVKALKVVGFTTSFWDEVATWVCPIWTDFVRGAVRGGSSSTPSGPQRPPSTGTSLSEIAATWARFLGDASNRYMEMGADWMNRVTQPGYGPEAALSDGAGYWLSVARDWSAATALSFQILQQLAGEAATAPPVFTGPVPPRPTAGDGERMAAPAGLGDVIGIEPFIPGAGGMEGTTLPIAGLGEKDPLACTGLRRLGSNDLEIPSSAIQINTEKIADNMVGAKVQVAVQNLVAGLYLGKVQIGPPGQTRVAPIQVYISLAKEAGSSGR